MSNQGPYGPPPGLHQGPPAQYGPPSGGPQYWGPPQGPPQRPPMTPPQGPNFGWGSNGFPPPPKKKNKTARIVVPVVLLGLAVVGFQVLGAVLRHDSDRDYTKPLPTGHPTTAPTEDPTAPATQAKPTKSTPPPPSDTDVVAKNRIYKTGVQKTVNCRESGARANSLANARKYYATVFSCLVRAWPKQVTLAGGRFVAPHLIPYGGSVETPCSSGGGGGSSFYCSSNQTIYLDAGQDLSFYKTSLGTWVRAEMTDTVAHEFGHHVQNLTGILSAEQELEYEFSGDKSLEMSRRLELQASCLGNVFLGANKSSYAMTGSLKTQLNWTHAHQGDEYSTVPDHGSRAVYPRWTNAGFVTRSPSACNTFTASSTSVR